MRQGLRRGKGKASAEEFGENEDVAVERGFEEEGVDLEELGEGGGLLD